MLSYKYLLIDLLLSSIRFDELNINNSVIRLLSIDELVSKGYVKLYDSYRGYSIYTKITGMHIYQFYDNDGDILISNIYHWIETFDTLDEVYFHVDVNLLSRSELLDIYFKNDSIGYF